MDKNEFRQKLIVGALQGFCSNAFLSQQIAILDATTTKRINANEILASLAIDIADRVIEGTSTEGDRDG